MWKRRHVTFFRFPRHHFFFKNILAVKSDQRRVNEAQSFAEKSKKKFLKKIEKIKKKERKKNYLLTLLR